MRKLLRAHMARIWKDKVLWCSTAVLVGFGGMLCYSQYRYTVDYQADGSPDTPFFGIFILLCLVLGAFCSLFLGTEYSDGAIRNKLIVGSTRTQIYLAAYLSCVMAGLLMMGVYWAVVCAVGLPLLGPFVMPWSSLLLFSGAGLMLLLAEAALFTLFSMLNRSKAVTAVITLLALVSLIMMSSYINSRLDAPETLPSYEFSMDGVVKESGSSGQPNPDYLTGAEREAYQFALDFLPTGQGLQLTMMEAADPGYLMLYSLLIVLISTGAGIYFFRRKDLN